MATQNLSPGSTPEPGPNTPRRIKVNPRPLDISFEYGQ